MQNLFLIAVMSFNELGPQLLKLSKCFRRIHWNITSLVSDIVEEATITLPLSKFLNAITLIQQVIYRDLKTMNVTQEVTNISAS